MKGHSLCLAAADAVGMCTILEVVVAQEDRTQVMVLSLVTYKVVIPDDCRSIVANVQTKVSH